MRVVADTNVFVFAILCPGRAREFLELARSGRFTLCISEDILEELRAVLEEKFL